MSRIILIFFFSLIFLGFLMSTTLNLYSDIQDIKTENQRLMQEITVLRSSSEPVRRERDSLKKENEDLHNRLTSLEQVYASENKARLKAESEASTLRATLDDMVARPTSPSACSQSTSKDAKSANSISLGVGFIAVASVVCVGVMGIIRVRRYYT